MPMAREITWSDPRTESEIALLTECCEGGRPSFVVAANGALALADAEGAGSGYPVLSRARTRSDGCPNERCTIRTLGWCSPFLVVQAPHLDEGLSPGAGGELYSRPLGCSGVAVASPGAGAMNFGTVLSDHLEVENHSNVGVSNQLTMPILTINHHQSSFMWVFNVLSTSNCFIQGNGYHQNKETWWNMTGIHQYQYHYCVTTGV